jgi:phage terminase Nu1 subunit (DNA packaging protein)
MARHRTHAIGIRLSNRELCELLGVDRFQLHRWRRHGLPHFKRQGAAGFVYDRGEVIAWLKATGRDGYIPFSWRGTLRRGDGTKIK